MMNKIFNRYDDCIDVLYAFYDDKGTVVAAGFTFTEPEDIEAKQTSPFEIIIDEPNAARKIKSASLNVDSSQYSSMVGNTQVLLSLLLIEVVVAAVPLVDVISICLSNLGRRIL
jgi:hypothetical protein